MIRTACRGFALGIAFGLGFLAGGVGVVLAVFGAESITAED